MSGFGMLLTPLWAADCKSQISRTGWDGANRICAQTRLRGHLLVHLDGFDSSLKGVPSRRGEWCAPRRDERYQACQSKESVKD